jgi:hypothetical protein
MSIQAEIGLNTTPFMKGVKEVQAATERMMKNSQRAAAQNGESSFGSLRGDKAVTKNTYGLAKDLLDSGSASDALGRSLDRTGKILKLGIAGGVIAGLASKFIADGREANEEMDKLHATLEGLKDAGRAAADLGGWEANIASVKSLGSAVGEITKQQEKLRSFKGFLGQLFTGGVFDGSTREKSAQLRNDKAEAQAIAAENAQAALEDLRLTSEIAAAKSQGHDEEAASLERERKLKRDLLMIDKSGLSDADKETAKGYARDAAASDGDAKDNAAARARVLEIEREIAAEVKKGETAMEARAHLGETEEQHQARLVEEISTQAAAIRGMERHQQGPYADAGTALAIAQQRATLEAKITELAKLGAAEQVKANQTMQRDAESRLKASPEIFLNAQKFAAQAGGDKSQIEAAERASRYQRHLESAKGQGFGADDARRLAADQTRLEELAEQATKSGSLATGKADADRRLGLGGYAAPGMDAARAVQDGNRIAAESRGLLADIAKILRNQKPPVVDTRARLN